MDEPSEGMERRFFEAPNAAPGRCARHPEAQALGTCARCGSFMCPNCVAPSGVCRECGARESETLRVPAERAAKRVQIAFLVYSATAAVSVLMMIAQALIADDIGAGKYDPDSVEAHDLRMQAIAIGQFAAMLGVVVLYCLWMNRAHRYLSPRATLEYGRNAWGWFFCPVLNLWQPYRAVKGLFQAASAADPVSAAGISAPAIFPLWWGSWLLFNLSSRVSETLLNKVHDAASLESASIASAFADSIGIGAALLALLVVRAIDRALGASASD